MASVWSKAWLERMQREIESSWIGLADADGRELRGAGYARRHAKWTVEIASDLSSLTATNSAAVTFAEAGGNWGRAVYTVLFDSAKEGEQIQIMPSRPPRLVEEGVQIVLKPKSIEIAFNNG